MSIGATIIASVGAMSLPESAGLVMLGAGLTILVLKRRREQRRRLRRRSVYGLTPDVPTPQDQAAPAQADTPPPPPRR